MKKKYIQPDMQIVVLSTNPLMLGGNSGGDINGSGATPPGVGGGSGSRLYRDFDEDEEDEEF